MEVGLGPNEGCSAKERKKNFRYPTPFHPRSGDQFANKQEDSPRGQNCLNQSRAELGVCAQYLAKAFTMKFSVF
jgi:hypothetical protein